jgi:hypothetical protein
MEFTVNLFQCHLGLHAMQLFSYLGIIDLVSMWFRMVWTHHNLGVIDPLVLTYPLEINVCSVLLVSYPRVGSLILCLMLVIDIVHSPIGLPVQDWL